MKTELKEIMFENGKEYVCLKTINLDGEKYYTEGYKYKCPSDNCLTDNTGCDLFITTNYLHHFFE